MDCFPLVSKVQSAHQAARVQGKSACMPLPDELWSIIIDVFAESHGIRAAKELRKVSRVSRVFATAARTHPEFLTTARPAMQRWRCGSSAASKARRASRERERGGMVSAPFGGAVRLLSESDHNHCVA